MNKLYVRKETPLAGCYEVKEASLNEVKNALSEELILSLASDILKQKIVSTDSLESPDAVRQYIQTSVGCSEREEFLVLLANTKHQIIHTEVLFQGTIDSATVYPREIVKLALKHNSYAVFVAHNHPSGCLTPSQADRRITVRIAEALNTVDVKLLDHFIVSPEGTLSFAEKGYI